MSKIRHLSRNRCSEDVIRAVFLDQLPTNCRSILALSDIEDLLRLSLIADKIVAQSNEQTVATVSSDKGLSEKVDALMLKVEALSTQSNFRSRNRSCSALRNRNQLKPRENTSNNQFSDNKQEELCYYHKKFCSQAKKCKPFCTMKKKSNSEN